MLGVVAPTQPLSGAAVLQKRAADEQQAVLTTNTAAASALMRALFAWFVLSAPCLLSAAVPGLAAAGSRPPYKADERLRPLARDCEDSYTVLETGPVAVSAQNPASHGKRRAFVTVDFDREQNHST